MPIDKTRRELEDFVRRSVVLDASNPVGGRFLLFGPAPSLKRRGEHRKRIDFEAGVGDDELGPLVDAIWHELDRLAEEDEPGYLYVLVYRTGADGYDDHWRCKPVRIDGEDPTGLSLDPSTNPGEWLQKAAALAIQKNTEIAGSIVSAWADTNRDLVRFAHDIGEFKGQVAEMGKAEHMKAQAEMAKAILPHLNDMVTKIAVAVAASRKSSQDEALDAIPEQPEELGADRLLWDLQTFEWLVMDVQAHVLKCPQAFTPEVRAKLKDFIAKAKASEALLDQLL